MNCFKKSLKEHCHSLRGKKKKDKILIFLLKKEKADVAEFCNKIINKNKYN
jgi:hypothetical protein